MGNLVLGSTGADVGTAQQLLVEAGETIDPGELRQAFYGPSTRGAVLDFQVAHLDEQHRPLAADGVIGPTTLAALRNPIGPADSFRAPGWNPAMFIDGPEAIACRAAIAEIGTQEQPPGSNRGPRVDQYEGPEWLGSPWCALFVGWCWGHADGGSTFGFPASALKIHDWGATNGTLIGGSDIARPGDIAVILRVGGHGHAELVVSNEQAGKPLSLVGGNVSNAVRGTVRERASLTAIVRPRR